MNFRYRNEDAAFSLLILVTTVAYALGVSGEFLFDDISNIVNVPTLRLEELSWNSVHNAAFSGFAGVLQRPIPVLSFAINYYFIGELNPLWFKWTNISIHILNGLLVYKLVNTIFEIKPDLFVGNRNSADYLKTSSLPFLIAALWLVHPLHISCVLYVVQRMTLLSATFSLLTLIFYISARVAVVSNQLRFVFYSIIGLIAFTAGLFSKENAALCIFFVFLIEWFVFGFDKKAGRYTKPFIFLSIGCGVIIPSLSILFFSLYSPDWFMEGYRTREFSLHERLLTQARLTWKYVGWIVIPDISNYGLHHDDIELSKDLFRPLSTIISILAWAICILLCIIFRRSLGAISLGLLFFLAGHLMESTIIPLELVFEHRNYLPSLGVLILFCCVLYRLGSQLKTDKIRKLTGIFQLSLILVLLAATSVRADKWGDPLYSSLADVRNHPLSARSHYSYASNLTRYTNFAANDEQIIEGLRMTSMLDKEGISGHYGEILQSLRMRRDFPVEVANDLIYRLGNSRLRPSTVQFLNDLVAKCLELECEPYFDLETLRKMLDAARSNPHNSKRRFVDFNLIWANYLTGYENNVIESITILTQLLDVDPENRAIHDYLLNVYVAGKSEEERNNMLEMLVKSNVGIRYPNLVKNLEEI